MSSTFNTRQHGPARLLWNLRRGRMQRTLALTTALTAPPLGFEMYLEHYKASFGDLWMWSPIVTSPLVAAAGLAGFRSQRAARTVLPAVSALYALNGAIGTITHLRGVQRRPGGLHEPTYNLLMGPPLLAPGSLMLVGMIGILAGDRRTGALSKCGSTSGSPSIYPICEVAAQPADPDELPRQRRGKTPQMHGRYPDYDVLEQRRPLG